MILVNLHSEIPNRSLDCPLGITRQWANAYSFRSDMSKQMNALVDKVDVVCMALVIKLLEFLYEVAKQFMAMLEIGQRYRPVLQDANTQDILTIIHPVLFCKYVPEKRRTKSDKVDLKLPSLVARVYLLCRVSGCATKARWNKLSCQSHSFSMSLPYITNQDAPSLELYIIRQIYLDCATSQSKQ